MSFYSFDKIARVGMEVSGKYLIQNSFEVLLYKNVLYTHDKKKEICQREGEEGCKLTFKAIPVLN